MPLGYCFFNSYVFSLQLQKTLARIVDSTGDDQGLSVAVDSSGNIYLAGYYTGTPTIKDQLGISLGTLPASGGNAAFVVKFDSSGTYQYARIVDSTSGADQGLGVTCDSSGNVYLSGYYNGTPTIKDQAGTSLGTLPAAGGNAAFVVKFDSSGTYQYARIVDSAGADQGLGVACDSSGNMYLAGYYSGTPTIKDQAGTSLGTLPSSVGGSNAAFVVKFNSSGTYQYGRIVDAGSTLTDQGQAVACDSSGNMYLAGYYSGTPTIKDQAGTSLGTLPATGSTTAAFVVKFNSSGTYQYARIVDASAVNDQGQGVACDSSGNVYLSGYYNGTPTIKDQAGTSLGTLPLTGSTTAAFVVKFDSTGTYQYARIVDVVGANDQGQGVACDSSGNMYLAGFYDGTATIKDQAGTSLGTLPASASATQAAFVVKFNSSGTYQYARIVDNASNDQGLGVTCDSSGNMYFAGFYGTVQPTIEDQAGNVLGLLPTSVGSNAAFLVKFDSSGNYGPFGSYSLTRLVDSTTDEVGFSVTTDSSLNFFFGGSYTGTPNIRDQAGTSLGTLPAQAAVISGFFSKFNSAGTYQNSVVLDSGSTSYVYALTCDAGSNLYAMGYYSGAVTIRNQAGTSLGTLPNYADAAYLMKFNSAGTYQWTRILTAPPIWGGNQCAVDSQNNVYMCGFYNADATIYNQAGTSLGTLTSLGSIGGFVVKFSTTGTLLYSFSFDATLASESSVGLATDSQGNVAVSGNYGASTSCNIVRRSGGVDTTIGTLPAGTGSCSYVTKFDSSGNILHSFVLDASGTDVSYGVSFDSSGNLYFCGYYNGTPTLYVVSSSNVRSTLTTFPASVSDSAFLVKANSSNVFQYARIIDTANNDLAWGIACDSQNSVYVSGYYNGTPTITNEIGTTLGTLPATTGTNTAFVCKFDSAGTYQFSRIIDSTGDNQARGLNCDSQNFMYVSGYYKATPTIKNESGSTIATLPASAGAGVAFVSRFTL